MEPTTGEGLFYLLAILGFIIVIFVLIREFWCWYFKINEISTHLSKIVKLLEGNADQNRISSEEFRRNFIPPGTVDRFISNRLMKVASETFAYSEPTTTAETSVKLLVNTTLHVGHSEGKWAQVYLPENKTQPLGWVHVSNLDPL